MNEDSAFLTDVLATGRQLLEYCRASDWAGYDPYDALNSPLFKAFPVLESRIPRLVLTQSLKRSPINIRPLLRVPKTQNPKGLALFLSALLKAPQLNQDAGADLVAELTRTLLALRSSGTPYWCWGYSFPWQTRTIVVPRAYPNLVCTTFVADVILDLYERRKDSLHLDIAVSAANYMLNDLYWVADDGTVASFNYPLPALRSQTHNANLLAAAFLCRIFKHTGDQRFLDPALKVARYSAAKQQPAGEWYYGEAPSQKWIDNFHTGYNLGALRVISRILQTPEFESCIQRGYDFYITHFFRQDGAARYFHDHTYPIDVHCAAQSLITLMEFQDLDPRSLALARSLFRWTKDRMWDEAGFFYYRVLRLCTIRTSYMRWGQSWMLLALASLLAEYPVVETPQSEVAASA